MMDLAERVSRAYESLPGLAMSLVTGSVARGVADDSSDLDVYLYWDHVDVGTLASSGRSEGVLGARLLALPTATGFFEKYRSGDRLVDVESVTIESLAGVASSLDRCEPMSPLVAKTMAGLRDAVPLKGAETLEAWRSRLIYSAEQAVVEVGVNLRRFLPPLADLRSDLGEGRQHQLLSSNVDDGACGDRRSRRGQPISARTRAPSGCPGMSRSSHGNRPTSCAECRLRSPLPIVPASPSSPPRCRTHSISWRPRCPQLGPTSNGHGSSWHFHPTTRNRAPRLKMPSPSTSIGMPMNEVPNATVAPSPAKHEGKPGNNAEELFDGCHDPTSGGVGGRVGPRLMQHPSRRQTSSSGRRVTSAENETGHRCFGLGGAARSAIGGSCLTKWNCQVALSRGRFGDAVRAGREPASASLTRFSQALGDPHEGAAPGAGRSSKTRSSTSIYRALGSAFMRRCSSSWWARLGSNQRPEHYECPALTD